MKRLSALFASVILFVGLLGIPVLAASDDGSGDVAVVAEEGDAGDGDITAGDDGVTDEPVAPEANPAEDVSAPDGFNAPAGSLSEPLFEAAEAPVSVADFDALKSALADETAGEIRLANQIDITGDITADMIKGEKIITNAPGYDGYHFLIDDDAGVTLDFDHRVTLDGQGQKGGVYANVGGWTLKNVTITGVKDGEHVVRAYAMAGQTVTLDHVTVTDCDISAKYGMIFNYNDGTLAIADCHISGNTVRGGWGYGIIFSVGELRVENSAISGNAGGLGSVVPHGGKLTLKNNTITGNTSGVAAVVFADGSVKKLVNEDNAFSGNVRTAGGDLPDFWPESAQKKPDLTVAAVKKANLNEGTAEFPVASGDLITDDALILTAVTGTEGAKIQFREKGAQGWTDFNGKQTFDFVNGIVGNQTFRKTYEFRAMLSADTLTSYSEIAEFEVNISVKNVPEFKGLEGTLKAGETAVYTSPVTVKVSGRYVTENAGCFLYDDGAGTYQGRTDIKSAADFTFTEPGVYKVVRYFDKYGQQIAVGDFTITSAATGDDNDDEEPGDTGNNNNTGNTGNGGGGGRGGNTATGNTATGSDTTGTGTAAANNAGTGTAAGTDNAVAAAESGATGAGNAQAASGGTTGAGSVGSARSAGSAGGGDNGDIAGSATTVIEDGAVPLASPSKPLTTLGETEVPLASAPQSDVNYLLYILPAVLAALAVFAVIFGVKRRKAKDEGNQA